MGGKSKLNPNQRDAVESDENLLCCACPGSGKTSVLIAKVLHILEAHPDPKIIMTTFSRAAADEMSGRLRLALEEARKEGRTKLHPGRLSALTIGTFHSLALSQLKKNGSGPKILREVESRRLMNRAIATVIDELPKDQAIFLSKTKVDDAVPLIENCRISPKFAEENPVFGRVAERYCADLTASEATDFTDILLSANAKMRSGELEPLHATHILADEWQDADEVQFEWLMHHCGEGRIACAVGDDDQAIYGFRNSRGYQGMMDFVAHTGARIINLDTNYRSLGGIIDSATALIQHNFERIPKAITAARGVGPRPQVILVSSKSSQDEESEKPKSEHQSAADQIAKKIREMAKRSADGRGIKVEEKQFAVLARTNRQLDQVEGVFSALGYPYIRSGKSFWDSQLLQVYLSMLEAVCTGDLLGYEVGLHWAKVPEAYLQMLTAEYGGLEGFLGSVTVDTLPRNAPVPVHQLVQQAHAWPRKLAGPDPERGANSVIHGVCGWMTTLLKQRRDDIEESSKSGSARRDALDTQIDILEMARNSLESANGTLQQRLFRVRNREKPEGASIALSTFHGSKGLEWEVVFLVDVHGGSVPTLDEAATDNDVAEERRVFYVAMTRARDFLYIYGDADRPRSEFLLEAELVSMQQFSEGDKKNVSH